MLQSEKEFLYYTSRGDIEGIRQGRWKLLVKKKRGSKETNLFLYDLKKDIGEQNDLSKANPKIVSNLKKKDDGCRS